MHLPGYTFEAELYRGRKRVVYRARRETDGVGVILKSFADEFPSAADTASLRREFRILRSLSIPGVARALALESHRDRAALVLEDAGDATLKLLVARGEVDLPAFFSFGKQLALTLAALHRAGILHKDVNPNNIVIDRTTGLATLTDFGIASLARTEPQRTGLPHMVEGTLAYMSPEQTGRMNRDLDHRSDLYSLGITFYEMLCGRLPFESADPLEVIHGHIAHTPPPIEQHNPAVPLMLRRLVGRLLAKSAEDRYQSGTGLAADLARCQTAWQESGAIPDFALGQDDVRDRFVIPQRLYGREEEVRRLLDAFERVAGGGLELVLVSGYSGIGKSTLIQETQRSLAQRGGHFIAGKFDQLARDVPYRALAHAFQTLMRQLLAESDAQIESWRSRLTEALGPNGQVVVDVIPELGRLIGPQPPTRVLEPIEAEVRFNVVFQQFLGVFARPEQPLVLFLDDLQWADSATLKVLPLFLSNPTLTGLLVIGAYRDNELSHTHPLRTIITELTGNGRAPTHLTLGPLSPAHLQALLGAVLGVTAASASELAEVVAEKTGGNPFFVTQFLRSLHQDGQIAFDWSARAWRADLPAIRALRMTDNVVDLMAGRIQRLPIETQRVLRLAACVGNRFDLATLATISEREPTVCAAELWPAVEQGLVVGGQRSYGLAPDLADGQPAAERWFHFLHDRVQQAAYELIPEAEKRHAHLTVGRLMLARGGADARPEWLFDTVNQLNYGAELLNDPRERQALAELNLVAGRKAKASAAFPSALGYFAAGAALVQPPEWETHHQLAFPLHLERAEAEYLCGRLADAEADYAALLLRSRSVSERTDVYVLRILLFETMARYQDAIRAGLEGLRALDVNLPEDQATQDATLDQELRAIEDLVAGRPVAGLLDLPRLEDDRIRQALRLLRSVWAPAYISTSGGLCALAAARMVRLSLQHGNSEDSAFGYLHHAITVGSLRGEYQRGHEFGELALALNVRLADLRLRATVHHRFAALVNPWCRSFEDCLAHAQLAVQAGLDSGNLQVAGYAQFQQSWYGMMVEPDLAGFHEKYAPNADFLARLQSPAFLEAQRLMLQWGLALRGLTESPTSFASPGFSEETFLRTFGQVGIFRGMYATLKLELLYTFGHIDEAMVAAREGEAVVARFFGSIWPAMFAFWHALTLVEWIPQATDPDRPQAEAKLEQLAEQFRIWAENAPANFRHLHLLILAGIARVRGLDAEVLGRFEAALTEAQRQPSPRHRALVNELYGRAWLEGDRAKVAAPFLAEARYGYAQWGAVAKAADCERRYAPVLGAPSLGPPGPRTLQTTQALDSALDLGTMIKATQALAGEIDLERLLGRLLRAAIEHAGAERGRFILEHDGAPAVHVTGSAAEVTVRVEGGTPLSEDPELPLSVINYVRRTGECLVLVDAAVDGSHTQDPYILRARPRSVIATPATNQGRLVGVLYLENNLAAGVFTADRAHLQQVLAAQAAIAIENARLFAEIGRLRDRLQAENVYLIEEIKTTHGFEEIVGQTPALRRVLSQVEQVAPTDSTVLITGETGTGKELLARAVHNLSPRKDRPLVTVNCGAISAGLVESELFGHEKGAFTGAIARKVGRFELADGGTIFLDEIGDLPGELQVKLLRVLQEGEIERVGGSRTIKIDVRIIAATHRDLEQRVRAGSFRDDLFYRLSVFPIRTPALRERREDIPLLVRYFVLKYALRLGKRIESIPPEIMAPLCAYDWPGNIRELGNVLERSVIVTRGPTLELGDWLPQTRTAEAAEADNGHTELQDVERQHILATLERTGWKVSGVNGAAAMLGLKPTTLESRMKKLGIRRPR